MGAKRSARRLPSFRGEAAIAGAIIVMNIATYGFTIVAARLLGPQPYGALAALMATLLVLAVLQLGLQATAARRIAADPGRTTQIERVVLGVTYRAALLLGLLVLLCSPLLVVLLHLDGLGPAVLVAVATVPLTIMGGQAGILLGERRWQGLSLVYLAAGVPRLVIGAALLLWRPSEGSAMLGVALAAVVPVVVGWFLLRRPRDAGTQSELHASRLVVKESLRNAQALLAFFTLSSADVVVARNVLDPHDAGLYAAGLIVTKAVLFLPQFVVVVAFPAMSTRNERQRALRSSLLLIGVLGVAGTAGAWVLSGLALVFVGGRQYAEVEGSLWGFAVLGTVLSMLQLLVYSVVARQGRRSVYLVWAALVGVVALGSLASSPTGLLVTVTIVDTLLLATLLVVNLSRIATVNDEEPDEDPAPTTPPPQ